MSLQVAISFSKSLEIPISLPSPYWSALENLSLSAGLPFSKKDRAILAALAGIEKKSEGAAEDD